MKIVFAGALVAALAVPIAASGLPTPASASEHIVFNYIGQQIVPNRTRFNGTLIGGLSSLDYNPATDRYLAISDDRSKARFYELSLDLALFERSATPGMEGVKFHSVTLMQGPDGGGFEKSGLDPEALRFDRVRNRIYWSSEGRRGIFGFANPAVREMNPDGSHTRDFPVPSSYFPRGSNMGIFPGDKGVYNNLSFESLAISLDGRTLYAATENGLVQDSPPSNLFTGSRARILSFDIASGNAAEEYIYPVGPVASAPSSLWGFATNGLTDFIVIGDRQFIAIERSFTLGALTPGSIATGFTVRLFYADARNATDVSGMDSIAGESIQPVSKTLLLDLSQLKNADGSPLAAGNIEGITFGPVFNGKRTIILVADNNFTMAQLTQFVALEISSGLPEP